MYGNIGWIYPLDWKAFPLVEKLKQTLLPSLTSLIGRMSWTEGETTLSRHQSFSNYFNINLADLLTITQEHIELFGFTLPVLIRQ